MPEGEGRNTEALLEEIRGGESEEEEKKEEVVEADEHRIIGTADISGVPPPKEGDQPEVPYLIHKRFVYELKKEAPPPPPAPPPDIWTPVATGVGGLIFGLLLGGLLSGDE